MNLWMVFAGFAAFGLLVGSVTGLSEAELTIPLLGLLFALIGGSIAAFLGKLTPAAQTLCATALLAFSIPATAAVYFGIYVRVNDLLGSKAAEVSTRTESYLKNNSTEKEIFLSGEVFRGRLTISQACEELSK